MPKEAAHVALPRRPREGTAFLSKGLQDREIRRQVEAHHHGQTVGSDADSGYWVDVGENEAVDGLRDVHLGAINVLCEPVVTGRGTALAPPMSKGLGDRWGGGPNLRGGPGPFPARPTRAIVGRPRTVLLAVSGIQVSRAS